MNWKEKKINAGTVKQNQIKQITFESTEDLTDKIKSINTSCGCTGAKYIDGKLEVNYRAQRVSSDKNSIQSIKINYINGTNETLMFKITIKK